MRESETVNDIVPQRALGVKPCVGLGSDGLEPAEQDLQSPLSTPAGAPTGTFIRERKCETRCQGVHCSVFGRKALLLDEVRVFAFGVGVVGGPFRDAVVPRGGVAVGGGLGGW
jgi:hypothetical protein